MANLAIGGTTERTPFALILNAQVRICDNVSSDSVKISEKDCLIIRGIQS
ncbi:MAG: hypothetical protein ABSB40_00565 [Nitrososphaeria archaeon]